MTVNTHPSEGRGGGCSPAPHLHRHPSHHSWRWLSTLALIPHRGARAPGACQAEAETRLLHDQPWGCLMAGVYKSLIDLRIWGSEYNLTFTCEETEAQKDTENCQAYLGEMGEAGVCALIRELSASLLLLGQWFLVRAGRCT